MVTHLCCVLCLQVMPPSKIRVIEVEEGESIVLKVKSMYPITLEFQKGTLVAFEVDGGIFTRFAMERPGIMEHAEEMAETQHEEDAMETQPFDYVYTPPSVKREEPPPRNITIRKSYKNASPMPLDFDDLSGETQTDI